MIPACVDYQGILDDLNRWGIRDYKIEAICGFAEGQVSKFKRSAERDMVYRNAARLYNFWFDERAQHDQREAASCQPLVATSS